MGARDRSGAPSSSAKYKQLAALFGSSVAKGSGCPGTFIELGESFKFSGKVLSATIIISSTVITISSTANSSNNTDGDSH